MEHRAISMDVILAGFRYVRRTSILLGSISLDLFAVLLGGAVALMPIFAEDILHAGPRGLGMLRAAPAVGALIVSFTLTWWPIQRRSGALMFLCVGIFGAATIFFGVSKSLPLLHAGAVYCWRRRTWLVSSSAPRFCNWPRRRRCAGRVSAVNSLFLGASNELGEFESGLTAQWWGAVRAVISEASGRLW